MACENSTIVPFKLSFAKCPKRLYFSRLSALLHRDRRSIPAMSCSSWLLVKKWHGKIGLCLLACSRGRKVSINVFYVTSMQNVHHLALDAFHKPSISLGSEKAGSSNIEHTYRTCCNSSQRLSKVLNTYYYWTLLSCKRHLESLDSKRQYGLRDLILGILIPYLSVRWGLHTQWG